MKKPNPLTKRALLFAVLLTFGAATERANVLPLASIGFAPVGLTMDQTAQLNLVNTSVPGGILVNWRFIDANGLVIAQSTVTLPLGTIVSVDYARQGAAPSGGASPSRHPYLRSGRKPSCKLWRYSTMIPARPRCSWAVQPHKQVEAWKARNSS